jgi:HCOMODA/2-hydroxy-3-carboxy-muconic semialdehyde decarboxylase
VSGSVLIEDLVAANRILSDHGVLDAYGHISARDPANPQRYWLSRSMAPVLVTAEDIIEFDLDNNPVRAGENRLFFERVIHGEIYKARPDVMSVVHNHSPSLIPFCNSDTRLRPMVGNAAFLGNGVPVSTFAPWTMRAT